MTGHLLCEEVVMPRVSEAYLRARRDEILDAALVSFARDGFLEATIEDIAREAGLSHGAIYRYFPSKEDIVEAVARRHHPNRGSRFETAQGGAEGVEALERVLGAYLIMHGRPEAADEGRLRLEMFSAAVRNPRVGTVLREAWEDVVGRFTEMVRRGQEQGEINPTLDPTTVARLITALHDGVYVHQTIEPSLDAPALLEVIEALLNGTFHAKGAREGG
jgi:AcrR family transcriptional regulator